MQMHSLIAPAVLAGLILGPGVVAQVDLLVSLTSDNGPTHISRRFHTSNGAGSSKKRTRIACMCPGSPAEKVRKRFLAPITSATAADARKHVGAHCGGTTAASAGSLH